MFLLILIVNILCSGPIKSADVAPEMRPDGRVTKGNRASINQFPYMVLLRTFNRTGHAKTCAGSIISKRYILTAAHCTFQKMSVDAYVGSNKFKKGQLYVIPESNIISHCKYNPYYTKNDIALLKTQVEVIFNAAVQYIALPPKTEKYSAQSNVGDDSYVAGWGQASDHYPRLVYNLQYAKLIVAPFDACSLEYNEAYNDTHICVATSNGISPCFGDSGGPLVTANIKSGGWVQLGVLAFGFGKCESEVPVVYTRVSAFLDWIEKYSKV